MEGVVGHLFKIRGKKMKEKKIVNTYLKDSLFRVLEVFCCQF